MENTVETTARNSGLQDLVTMLQEQHVRKVDMVVPASALASVNGQVQVTDTNLPFAFEHPDKPGAIKDQRSFMLRTFVGDGEGPGIARALLSNSYQIVDNLDVLVEALGVVKEAGVEAYVDRCNLTDRRMSVEIVVPEIQVLAEELLEGYRNPFGSDFDRWRGVADREGLGYGGKEPVVWAGFKITNSETGGGAYQISPVAKIKVCANGLVLSKDVVRAVHLGGRLEDGVIRWSAETQRQNLELIKSKTRDAVTTFLDRDYITSCIAKITEQAVKEVRTDEVKVIAKRAKFTEQESDLIFDYFVRGGQTTRGGIMNAVTAASQMVADADQAHDMEARALAVLTA